jgi:predicted membrane protein
MNKLLLTIIVGFVGFYSNAQEFKCIKLKEVVWLTDSTTAAQDEYLRAKLFFANEYRSAKDVISFDDQATHTIIGRGWIDLKSKNAFHKSAKLWHTLKIECKNGRYRYELSDLKIELKFSGFYGGTQTSFSDYAKVVGDIEKMKEGKEKDDLIQIFVKPINDLISKLNAEMNNSSKEDW